MKETYWLIYRSREKYQDVYSFTKAKPFTSYKAAHRWCFSSGYELVDVIRDNKKKTVTVKIPSVQFDKTIKDAVKDVIRGWIDNESMSRL